jgi:copper chaperone CopZ
MTVRLLPGIQTIEADFKTRTAHIVYDPDRAPLAIIQQALADIGYDAQPQPGAPSP